MVRESCDEARHFVNLDRERNKLLLDRMLWIKRVITISLIMHIFIFVLNQTR